MLKIIIFFPLMSNRKYLYFEIEIQPISEGWIWQTGHVHVLETGDKIGKFSNLKEGRK